MYKIAILGASGYTGLELLRILAAHPQASVVAATSRQYAGKPIDEVFPSMRGFYPGLAFVEKLDKADMDALAADVVFCALPHGASQEAVASVVAPNRKVIDLSADFRLKDAATYNKWYGEHKATQLLKDAVYGLPELGRDAIKGASLVANPGCYPTGAALAIAPLLGSRLVRPDSIVIDSKSGVSGAGRSAAIEHLFTEVSGAFKAYKVGSHRHTPEIEQTLSSVAGEPIRVTFTPHLLPISRGILTTAYSTSSKAVTTAELHAVFTAFYRDEPFVRIMPVGKFPDVSGVRASNYCDIGVFADETLRRIIVISAIDNLVKGASGQAVQNMNLMLGIKETTALTAPPVQI